MLHAHKKPVSAVLLAFTVPFASAQSLLVEVGAQRGIESFTRAPGLSAGIAAEDFDGDGDVDLFVPNGVGALDQVYLNDGRGQFTESAASLGLAYAGNHRAGLWFDADGDGDLDLVTAGDCYEDVACTGESSVRLHRQRPDGTFEEITTLAGLSGDLSILPDTHVGGLAAGDIDNDGDLDLFVVFWEGGAHLFMNDGQGQFTDEAQPRGLDLVQNHWQPVMFDFSGDGHLDIFQAVDFTANRFWINQGNATFVDEAPALGMNNAFNEMGVNLGDPDRDGDLDLYVTNIHTSFGWHNLFYARGPAPLQYSETSGPLGIQDSGCGWGNSFVDLDLNGWQDLVSTDSCSTGKARVFLNDLPTSGTFLNVSRRVGIDGRNGTGLVTFDMDGDGDRDVVQADVGQLRLFENRHVIDRFRRFLVVKPRMAGGNPTAIGTKVTVINGAFRTARAILAGSSIMSQEPAQAHFGLGTTNEVDVLVEWPDGTSTTLLDVAANQVITVTKP